MLINITEYKENYNFNMNGEVLLVVVAAALAARGVSKKKGLKPNTWLFAAHNSNKIAWDNNKHKKVRSFVRCSFILFSASKVTRTRSQPLTHSSSAAPPLIRVN